MRFSAIAILVFLLGCEKEYTDGPTQVIYEGPAIVETRIDHGDGDTEIYTSGPFQILDCHEHESGTTICADYSNAYWVNDGQLCAVEGPSGSCRMTAPLQAGHWFIIYTWELGPTSIPTL